jgi:competence protein ComEA
MRLDVNRATDVELNALPGIGPRLAERVAADRKANGHFESIEDLQRVHGVGPRLVERVRPYVICDG